LQILISDAILLRQYSFSGGYTAVFSRVQAERDDTDGAIA